MHVYKSICVLIKPHSTTFCLMFYLSCLQWPHRLCFSTFIRCTSMARSKKLKRRKKDNGKWKKARRMKWFVSTFKLISLILLKHFYSFSGQPKGFSETLQASQEFGARKNASNLRWFRS